MLRRPLIGPGRFRGRRGDGIAVHHGGVWMPEGHDLTLAAHAESMAMILRPAPPDPARPVRRLAGTWLFGGAIRAHFGHMLTESLARLWALDLPDPVPVNGVIWVALEKEGITPNVRQLLTRIKGLPPVRIVARDVVQPERLILPRQEGGAGVGLLLSPALAAGLRQRFAQEGGHPGVRAWSMSHAR